MSSRVRDLIWCRVHFVGNDGLSPVERMRFAASWANQIGFPMSRWERVSMVIRWYWLTGTKRAHRYNFFEDADD